jgi:hypothetical protein
MKLMTKLTKVLYCSMIVFSVLCVTCQRAQAQFQVPGCPATTLPATVQTYNNQLYLFTVCTDGAIYLDTTPGNNSPLPWSGFSAVPNGACTAYPVATTVYNGDLYLFLVGANNTVYYMYYNGTSWSTEYNYAASSTNNAVSVAVYNGQLYLFLTGTNGTVYEATYNGTSWSAYTAVPGNQNTSIAVTAVTWPGKNELVLYTVASNIVSQNVLSGASWSGSSSTSSVPITSYPVTAIVDPGTQNLCLFVTGTEPSGTNAAYLTVSNGINTPFNASWPDNEFSGISESTSAGEIISGNTGSVYHFLNQGKNVYYQIDSVFGENL